MIGIFRLQYIHHMTEFLCDKLHMKLKQFVLYILELKCILSECLI